MERPNMLRAASAGLFGTLVMTFLMVSAPVIGLPKLDMGAITGAFVTDSRMPALNTDDWWIGVVCYFVLGAVVLAGGYVVIYPLLRGPDWLRGLLWGLFLWLILEMAVLPMIGLGFFSATMPRPHHAVIIALLGHIAYGLILGLAASHTAPEELSDRRIPTT